MRAKYFTYTLAVADDSGFWAGFTGEGPWTAFASQPGDGCGHQVTLTSISDLSGITFTILGTDAEGRSLTEDLIGPNSSKVYSVKYFKTVTSLTASSTLGAFTCNLGWLGGGAGEYTYTPIYPVAVYPRGGHLVGVRIVSGAMEYTVQQTNDVVFGNDDPVWYTLGTAALAVNSEQQSLIGITGIRLRADDYKAVTFELKFVQALK